MTIAPSWAGETRSRGPGGGAADWRYPMPMAVRKQQQAPVPVPPEEESENHRTRVGAERRERTRLRLIESALTVFVEKQPDETVIDDFIAAAGVSRGTFYNYFRTTGELLYAVAAGMSDEILQIVDPIVLTFDDPVHRFSCGTRLYMKMAVRYAAWGRFITRVGTRIASRGQLIELYLTRDLKDAMQQGRVRADDLLVARDLVLGSIFYGIETMLTEQTIEEHPEHLMRSILIGLGMHPDEAREVATMPLPEPGVPEGTIFSRLTPMAAAPKARASRKRPRVAPAG